MSDCRSARGFSLLEVLVAMAVLTVGLTGLAQLFALTTRATASAKATTVMVLLAQQKMEELRSLAWSFTPIGLLQSDAALSASPDGALADNVAGCFDFVDRDGQTLGEAPDAPEGAEYIRRWSIDPWPPNPDDTIVLQVVVTRHRAGAAGGDVRLVSIRTRKGP